MTTGKDEITASSGELALRDARNRPTEGYDAFISYSHSADAPLASILQAELKRFGKPWYRPRGLRIFRDTTSMSASPALREAIEASLAASRYLIVLASPSAAQSIWVLHELTYWLDRKSADTILIVLTDGELAWNATGPHFDTKLTTSLPGTLADRFAVEPRYVDLRWLAVNTAPPTGDPRLRDAVADLAAPLHGRSKDEMIGEDIRQHRKLIRWRNLAIALLSVLLLVSVSVSVVAVRRGDQLAADLAVANAGALAQKALVIEARDPAAATQFALAAFRSDPTNPQARTALADRYLVERSVTAVHPHVTGQVISAIQQSTDGQVTRVDTGDGTTTIFYGREGNGQLDHWTPPLTAGAQSMLSPDGRWLVSSTFDGNFILFNTQGRFGTVLFNSGTQDGLDHLKAHFSADGRYVGIVTPQGTDAPTSRATIWDLTREPTATKVADFPLPYRLQDIMQVAVTNGATALLISATTTDPATLTSTSRADAWAPATGGKPTSSRSLPADAAFSADATEYYICSPGFEISAKTLSTIRAVDTETGATKRTISVGNSGVCSGRTADEEHMVIGGGAATGPRTSTRAPIISLRTGKSYDVTIPIESGDLPASDVISPTWPAIDSRISVRDMADGGLAGTAARGNSLFDFSGEFDWLPATRYDSDPSLYKITDDGRYLIMASSDRQMAARAADTGEIKGTLVEDPAENGVLGFDTVDANTNLYHLYQEDQEVHADYSEWSLPEFRLLAHYILPSAQDFGPPSSAYVATTADRLYALVGAGRALSIFDRHTNKEIGEPVLIGPPGRVAPSDTGGTLLIDPNDSDRLIASSTDGRIVAWSISGQRELATLPIAPSKSSGNDIAFSVDGRILYYIDKDHQLQSLDSATWKAIRPGFSVPKIDNILGVTTDGYLALNENVGGEHIEFWDQQRGIISGTMQYPAAGTTVLKDLTKRPTLTFGSDTMPQRLDTTGQVWFDSLCRINGREMSEVEKAQAPAGASTNPCNT